MENPINPAPNANESHRPNPNLHSIDGFSRPVQPPPTNDSVVSSISLAPNNSSDTQNPKPPVDNNIVEPHMASEPALATPITSKNVDQKRSKIWTIVLIILILVVFVGGVYGVYAYQQKKINSLNNQVSTLTIQTASLKVEVNKLNNSPSVSVNSQPNTSATQTLFKIPELGVSFTEPANLADLTYVINAGHTTANISTQNLATLESTCTASTTEAPLGSITKVNGQYPTSGSATTTLVKQYSAYYIAYIKPTGSCSTVTQINSFANSLTTDFKNTFTTIQLISS